MYKAARRGADILVALALLVLTLPVWLAAIIAIVAQDGGTPFFRQTRIGLGGRPFRMWKFRTMVRDAERLGPYHTRAGDPRITRVGQILRKTSIDELPQVLNVLAGDMSLIGPRPDTPAQQGLYSPADWTRRCSVPPGITGYAQVMAKAGPTPRSRLDLDLDYIDRAGPVLDLWIAWRTVAIVVRGRNR